MKRNLPSVVTGTLLVIILGLYMVTYQVRERYNQVAVVRTLGKVHPGSVKTVPGTYFKWPWPIQQVSIYDNRLQVTQTTGEETPTRDGKNVIVTTSIGWRIDDPYTFSTRNTDENEAREKLRTRVRDAQKTVIADYDFANFISDDPKALRYDEIERRILEAVANGTKEQKGASELYGIRVEFIGFDRLALPKQITDDVFEAMRQEKKAQAATYTSQGESEAAQIKARAERIAGIIEAFAKRKADEIVAEGLERAARYNATFAKDQGLANFLLEIDFLPKMYQDRTTVILDSRPPNDLLRSGAELAGGESPTTQPASPAKVPVAQEGAQTAQVTLPELTPP